MLQVQTNHLTSKTTIQNKRFRSWFPCQRLAVPARCSSGSSAECRHCGHAAFGSCSVSWPRVFWFQKVWKARAGSESPNSWLWSLAQKPGGTEGRRDSSETGLNEFASVNVSRSSNKVSPRTKILVPFVRTMFSVTAVSALPFSRARETGFIICVSPCETFWLLTCCLLVGDSRLGKWVFSNV